MTRRIYLDHAATTAVDPQVLEAMLPFWTRRYGNPSSSHWAGQEARAALDNARGTIADILGAQPSEIFFTSCGTESDNLALRGVADQARHPIHIITTSIEHHAVLHTCQRLEQLGHKVTYLPVNHHAMVDPDDVRSAMRDDTALISIMFANNEVGTIQPIGEIGQIARERGILMHTDAVQAAGALPLDVARLGIDLMAVSGHKLYAPKGVGLLFKRHGVELLPSQTGGSQEQGLRAGTENVPLAVGLAKALEIAYSDSQENQRVARLRDRLISAILSEIPDTLLTGHPCQRLPNSASFCFHGIDGEALLLHLDLCGIAASSGSACTTGEHDPSHVLLSMGIDARLARGSLRLTLGRENTDRDVNDLLAVLPDIVSRLRQLSPLYSDTTSPA